MLSADAEGDSACHGDMIDATDWMFISQLSSLYDCPKAKGTPIDTLFLL